MTSLSQGSVTVMIRGLRAGDRDQVAALWGRYFDRLSALASRTLRYGPQDGGDAALSAINALCDGIASGKFPYVEGREVLWKTLATITERKALQYRRRWKPEVPIDEGNLVIEPTDEYAEIVRLTVAELIEGIEDPRWRQAVRLHLEGHTVPEIARRMGRGRECIYVWFRAIRKIWQEKSGGEWPLD